MHVTLAFLGAVPDERLDDVVGAVRDAVAGHRPFSVSLATLGRFPPRGAPTVAWLGIGQGATEIAALAESVRRSLAAWSLPFDTKPFRPHLTLARVREHADRDEVRAIAAAIERGRVGALYFTTDAVSVVESVLSTKGPRYTARAVVPLAVGGKA
jgi:2'-5' RNA ligase